ncbi:conserved Plasmodium protein, unknown function [Plasmodium malariae]|uniref:Uncharacterized protein n=2 Tax=Plasmodium malariae TaxID=5858 RepID=A0A1D3TCK5_PLAMA|nr:conserved Plasmodium protein, unknown function [Plasmodium malariae]SCP02607.1 conserved Plasmodium protein, unknown function [Plasmodium malariae]
MENINKKDIFVNYLKMCNKNDMARAVMKYCDEDHGIVFNKHPARNENKFGKIYDFSVSELSKITNVSNSSDDSKKMMKQKSHNSFDRIVQSKCFYKSKISFKDLQKVGGQKNAKTRFNKIQRDNEGEKENDPISEIINDMCEIIAPEGKGKFLKFIGENYGTYNCYPIELLKLNRSYLKKNSLYNFSFNYKDIALNHTRNVLKSKNNALQKDVILTEKNKQSDQFHYFSKDMDYLKDYIINDSKNNTGEEINSLKEDFVHLSMKSAQRKRDECDKIYPQGHKNIGIKENVKVITLNNIYKMESANSYIPIDYTVSGDEKFCIYC